MCALVDVIFRNRFYTVTRVPSDKMSLGEVLAEPRLRRALEIGMGQGGTLLFLVRLAGPTATIASIDLESGERGGYSEAYQGQFSRHCEASVRMTLVVDLPLLLS